MRNLLHENWEKLFVAFALTSGELSLNNYALTLQRYKNIPGINS